MNPEDMFLLPEPGTPSELSAFTEIAPASDPIPSWPLVRPDLAGGHISMHGRAGGIVPPIGFHRLVNARVGHEGLVLAAPTTIFAPSDVVPSYWRRSIERRLAAPKSNDPLVGAIEDQSYPTRDLSPDHTHILVTKSGEAVYGHWLLDMLPRIWLGLQNRQVFAKPTRFLVTSRSPPWAFDLIEQALGVEQSDIVCWDDRTESVRVPDLAIPSLLRTDFALSPLMQGFVDTVRQRLGISEASSSHDRLFITRKNVVSWSPRRLGNHDEIEAVFNQHAFSSFDPAPHPWRYQVGKFNAASIVAGEFGSGLHTTLFAGPTTANLVLGYSHLNTLQSAIAALRGQRIGYLAATSETTENGVITYAYDPNKLAELVSALAHPEVS